MSWHLKSFNELGFIGRGKSRHRPRNDESLYGGKFPMIQTGDVKAANFYLYEFNQTYNEKGLAQSKLWEPDTLCITIAANIAETAILGINACFPDSIIGFVANDKVCDVRFVKYFFDVYKAKMQSVSQGTTQDNLSLEKLLKFKVPTPLLKTQKRIADILSAYDNLIENNLKRINLLEQAAQNIYKEWFVNMRFPGYESAEIDSETGLPEGWKKETVKDYVKIASKGPSLNYNTDSGIPVLNQSCVRNKEIELEKIRYAEELKENKSHCYLQINDILINSMGQGTLGRVSKNNSIKDRFIIHNCITFLRAKDIYSQAFLFHFISSKEDYFISIAQGSTGQTTLKLELVTGLEIIIPATRLLKAFDKIVLDFWSQIGNLKQQNKKLKQARDILLPRLMNQTIEV